MPSIKRIGPYEFRFFLRGEASEPAHIHVEREDMRCKFWLEPVELADPGRFKGHELRHIAKLVEENQKEFLYAWRQYFA